MGVNPTTSFARNIHSQSQTGLPTTGGFSAGSAALFIPALTGLIGAFGAGDDIKRQNRAIIANIESEGRSLNFSLRQKNEQMKDLDRAVGDRLSETGFEAMVTEARLRTASAETGVSGTTAQEATSQADVQRLHTDAVILRESDLAKQSLMTSAAAELLNFKNTATSLRSSQRSSSSAALNVFSSSLSGFNSGLNFLNTSQKERLFGTDVTGEKNV